MEALAQDAYPEITAFFVAGSPLESCLSGFAPRAGQALMAANIAAAIENRENLVVEAGTGTGKTLAYLIPSLLAGRKVILSTGTKTLQDQLYFRDLPAVASAIGRPARTVQLKGRSNYLCLQRLETARYSPAPHEAELRILHLWGDVTRSGDKVEVSEIPEESAVWPRVTSTVDNCLGAKCDFYDRCHVFAARQAALKADIVVVNHHLLLADLVLKEEGFGELLPGCEAVVIDEAHQFPDIAQGFFNVTLSSKSILDLADDFSTEARSALVWNNNVGELADRLNKLVRDARLALPRDGTNLLWEELQTPLEYDIADIVACLDDVIVWLDSCDEGQLPLKRCRERASTMVNRIEQISSSDETAGLRWVGLTRLGFSINYTPVEIAESLRALLDAQGCAWIFTSATLAVASNFGHFLQRMGLCDETHTLAIESPFNYQKRGLLLLPPKMPDPASASYTQSMLDVLLPLIDASQGRAFLLFTSYRALNEAAALLRNKKDFDFPLLVQGESPRSKLLEQFTVLDKPVLLGTSSFWEGVDMRGDQLVLVAIDRLPFASPGDPLTKARLEAIRQRGGNPFRDYQLPQAVLGLKQGVGRLIRDFSDYGVVVVCDPRIGSRSYGRQFLASLPAFPVSKNAEDARKFLATGPV